MSNCFPTDTRALFRKHRMDGDGANCLAEAGRDERQPHLTSSNCGFFSVLTSRGKETFAIA